MHFSLDKQNQIWEDLNMKALNQSEIENLLSTIRTPYLRCAVLLAYRHGMRASEVCNLQWSDIDMDAKTIVVRRLKGSLLTVQPIGQEEIMALNALRGDLPRFGRRPSPYVFPARHSGRLNRGTLAWLFKRAAQAAGIPVDRQHFHVLKHSLGRALVSANVNMAVIKQALGHVSLSSTAVYTMMDDETVGKIVQEALK